MLKNKPSGLHKFAGACKKALAILAVFQLPVTPCALAQSAREWTSFKASDGLIETPVTNVTIGRKGTVWLTHPHLQWISRYDGFDFSAVPAPSVRQFQVAEGPGGQLWCLDSEGVKFYRADQSSWVRVNLQPPDDSLPRSIPPAAREFPRFIATQKNHALLLYTNELLDIELTDQAGARTTVLLRSSRFHLENFLAMTASPDGSLVVLGNSGLLRANGVVGDLSPATGWKETSFPPGDSSLFENPSSPVFDKANGVTILTGAEQNRAVHLDLDGGNHWFAITNSTGKLVKAWATGGGKEFLLFTQSGIARAGAETMNPIAQPEVNFIYDAAPNSDGSFWMATAEGLLRHASALWEPVGTPGTNDFSQMEIAAGPGSQLWMAGEGKLILLGDGHARVFDIPAQQTRPYASSRPVIAAGSKGAVLLAVSGQLFSCGPSAYNLAPVPLPDNFHFDSALPLGHGQLCLVRKPSLDSAGQDFSITIFDGDTFHSLEPKPPGKIFDGKDPLGVVSTTGDYWFCGNGHVARFHQNGWQQYSPGDGAPNEQPSCMMEFSPGTIWIGFSDRIMQFDGAKWAPVRAGLLHVHAMHKSPDGSVWVAAENGVHQFRKEVWLDNGIEEGLPANSVRQIVETQQGEMVAMTSRGLAVYRPDADTDAPRAVITTADGSGAKFGEGAFVSFLLNGTDKWKQTPSDRLLFSYRMDEREWSPYQEQRYAAFPELGGGEHRIQVRCMDRNWNVAKAPASLAFSIFVPWYRETRLVLISAMGCAAVLFFAALALNRHLRLVKSFAEVEATVALRTKQLDLANRELFHSQKMNALGTLAAGIAHDFNNILSIIKGSAQIIEDNLDDEKKIRLRTERIRTVVEQGSGIVKAMLGFSSTSGQPPAPCDVNSVVRETILLLGDRFLRDVQVRIEQSPEPLPEVVLSKDFTRQIILNFIFNAAEASPQRKPVSIRSSLHSQLPVPLALKPATSPEYVFIAVKDQGTGISPEIMPRIFEPFFTTKALGVKRGTGLGLSMAYELARRMNCGLAVESAPGKGSTFTLIIPVAPAKFPDDDGTGRTFVAAQEQNP